MNENDNEDLRVALVSGGSRGIGAAVTIGLTQRGCRVGCTYRTGRDEAEKLTANALIRYYRSTSTCTTTPRRPPRWSTSSPIGDASIR